jgi:hypothetical protein
MEPMQARRFIWDYKIKYCMKEPSKKALDALELAEILLTHNIY